MGVIRQLPPSVINQIAAGEVVERPASVVKELLENAIDAGATRVDVAVERGGKDLVRVADNGAGLAPDDLLLAFQPHATSKLADAEDLYRVRTLGFRGEALAAIAEVSRVRCQTRQPSASEGSEIVIEAGIAGPIRSCGGPAGTVMEVRNLFFNTPVRRTFLKSDTTEAGHVAEAFSRIALAHPEVHMTFRSRGKVVHDLPAVTGVRERIGVFFGRELAESLLWIEGKLEKLSLWGYVAHPSQSRSSNKGQFLFLGGRYVRDRSLSHALSEAYRGLLMVGRNPVVFLHIEIPPEEVDVNVHPTKIEVRFRDPQRVYSHLLSTLRQTFLSSDLHSRLQAAQDQPVGTPAGQAEPSPRGPESEGVRFETSAAGPSFGLAGRAPDRQSVASWFEPSRPRPEGEAPQIPDSVGQVQPPEWSRSLPGRFDFGPGDEFNEFSGRTTPANRPSVAPASDAARGMLHSPAPGEIDSGQETLKAIQVHDSYLIAETKDGMMVIDQHALHERILYEELRQRVAAGKPESQGLLVPEPVHLSADEAASVLEQRELLGELGLELEEFGGDTVLVRSTPVMLKHLTADRLVRDLAEHLHTQPIPPTRDGLVAELLHMVACKAAVKAGDRLDPEEIAALLERRHLVADSHHCPHGRPTALVFTKAELEKQFGRI
jgi:DNA mismatch repair protein MutL